MIMRISPYLTRFCVLTALVLPLSVGCRASAPRGASASPTLRVVPFTVEPQALPGAPADPGGVLQVLLAEEAASSAREALARGGPGELAGVESIAGTVQMPVSLPPEVRGLDARHREGHLATATVRLLGPDGKTVRQAEASLAWWEVRWLEGPPRYRRYRSSGEVLRDAVGKVVERAVERLRKGHST